MSDSPVVICFSSYFKGARLIQACKEEGCHVILLTKESMKEKEWPWEFIDEVFYMPDLHAQPDVTYAVSYLMRERPIAQLIALDDFDVEVAAALREHLRLPGIGDTLARHFRDKLAMRMQARASGILVPEFTAVFNYDKVRAFMARVPLPWVLKPRSEASAMGIKKINHPDELWQHLDELGDKQSYFLLESFVAGDVYHVDGLVVDGEVVFQVANQYGRPPMSVYQGGGVFMTRTLDRQSDDAKALYKLNPKLLKGLGLMRGASHAEYIKSAEDGRFYFLEVASRVGGANIAECAEFATGVNLWAEWGKIEVAHIKGEKYELPPVREEYAGILNCLARQEWPDLSGYNDPEIVWRMHKKWHAGLIAASADANHLESLLNSYAERFGHDFLAVLPPLESEKEMHDE
jgi:biotin carboxylase